MPSQYFLKCSTYAVYAPFFMLDYALMLMDTNNIGLPNYM